MFLPPTEKSRYSSLHSRKYVVCVWELNTNIAGRYLKGCVSVYVCMLVCVRMRRERTTFIITAFPFPSTLNMLTKHGR